jgi:hypothetical protein
MDFWNTVHGNCGHATWHGLLEHCPRQVPWPQTEDCAAAGPEGPATGGHATWHGLLECCPRHVPWPQTEDCAAVTAIVARPHGLDFWYTVQGNCGHATWHGLLEYCPRQVPWPQTEDCAATGPEGPATIVARPLGLDFWNTVHGMCRGHITRSAS